MEQSAIQNLVFDALTLTNQSREKDMQIPTSKNTVLFADNGWLDSMGLVALLIDVEDMFQDQGITISLSDERAMSSSHSPFRDVTSLANYIFTLLREK
jgi:acyl carrier protein